MPATILIVEDEHAVARGIQYALQQEGYAVTVAPSGELGLEIATTQAPDLVLLDVRLPGIDGFEVLRQIRTFSDAYVLMLTARSDEVDRIVGLSVGADDYLVKPFAHENSWPESRPCSGGRALDPRRWSAASPSIRLAGPRPCVAQRSP